MSSVQPSSLQGATLWSPSQQLDPSAGTAASSRTPHVSSDGRRWVGQEQEVRFQVVVSLVGIVRQVCCLDVLALC